METPLNIDYLCSMNNLENMDIQAKKLELFQMLLDVNEASILRKVEKAISDGYASEPIGHDADGIPIDKDKLRKRVQAASKRVKSGDYIAQEEIEKEIKNW
jgi:hypothetical protein